MKHLNSPEIDDQADDILDTRGAAAYVKLSTVTLERKRILGGGPPFAKLFKSIRYRRSDLDRWVASRVIASTSEIGKGQK